MGWQDVDNSEDAWMDDYDYDDPNDPVIGRYTCTALDPW
jgi:hypothetical protein